MNLTELDVILKDYIPFIALASGIPVFLFTLHYGVGTKGWWKTGLGVILFSLFFSIAMLFGLAIFRRFFGEYPGYNLISLIVYGLLFIFFWAWYIVFIRERGRGNNTIDLPITKHTDEIPVVKGKVSNDK